MNLKGANYVAVEKMKNLDWGQRLAQAAKSFSLAVSTHSTYREITYKNEVHELQMNF